MISNKIILLSVVLLTTINSSSQSDYCTLFNSELEQALQRGKVSEIDYYYYKLFYTCGVSSFYMGYTEEVLAQKGIKISWYRNGSYEIIGISNPLIDINTRYSVFSFEELPDNDPIKKKYINLDAFLKKIRLDDSNLPVEPYFIPEHKTIWVKQSDRDMILDYRFKKIVSFEGENKELNYAGGGIFISNQQDRCLVFSIPIKKMIIDHIGQATVIPISHNKSYVAVEYMEDGGGMALYNHNGQRIFNQQDNILFNPLSKTIILNKNENYKLIDSNLDVMYENATYITEIWKDDEPYFIIDDAEEKQYLYNKNLKIILSGLEYESIYIDRTPYAIVNKNGKYAVLDFTSQKELIAYQNEKIKQLYPGFLTYSNGDIWTIIDEQNRKIGTITTTNIYPLTMRSKALILAINESGKKGIYDLFGTEILAQQYDNIEYNTLENILLVTLGQIQFKVDLEGKTLH